MTTGSNYILDPGLVLYLPLHEPDGSSFISRDAYGHVCTSNGALWKPDGRYFDGVDDFIDVPHHTCQLLNTGGTIMVWFKSGTNMGRIVDKTPDLAGTGGYILSCYSQNRVYVRINAGSVITSAANAVVFGDGNWYHTAGVWNAVGYITIYVNGRRSGTQGKSGSPGNITTTDDLRIGNRSGTLDRPYDGFIAEVRLHNRALMPQEIQKIYLATRWRYR